MQIRRFYVYILKCSDGSYYVGMTSDLTHRFDEHQSGADPQSYTHSRRPVELVWQQEFSTHEEAFQREKQIKGWSHKKKEALIRNDYGTIHQIVHQEFENEKKHKLEKGG